MGEVPFKMIPGIILNWYGGERRDLARSNVRVCGESCDRFGDKLTLGMGENGIIEVLFVFMNE